MKRINAMYHTDAAGRLVKTSNNQPVPDDEPVFILRGRDQLAIATLHHYVVLCEQLKVPVDRIADLETLLREFARYRADNQDVIKLPGITHGR